MGQALQDTDKQQPLHAPQVPPARYTLTCTGGCVLVVAMWLAVGALVAWAQQVWGFV